MLLSQRSKRFIVFVYKTGRTPQSQVLVRIFVVAYELQAVRVTTLDLQFLVRMYWNKKKSLTEKDLAN